VHANDAAPASATALPLVDGWSPRGLLGSGNAVQAR